MINATNVYIDVINSVNVYTNIMRVNTNTINAMDFYTNMTNDMRVNVGVNYRMNLVTLQTLHVPPEDRPPAQDLPRSPRRQTTKPRPSTFP